MNFINIAEQSQQPLNYNKYSIHIKPVFKLIKVTKEKKSDPNCFTEQGCISTSDCYTSFQFNAVTFFWSRQHLHDPSVHSSHRTIISAKTWLTDHSGEEYESGFFTPSADKGKECTILHQLCYTSLNVRSLPVDPADPPPIKQRLKN